MACRRLVGPQYILFENIGKLMKSAITRKLRSTGTGMQLASYMW
jgi:hypothetical protein